MALAKEDYQAMEEHVRKFLTSWLAKQEKYSFGVTVSTGGVVIGVIKLT
jgi:hypothetical protein